MAADGSSSTAATDDEQLSSLYSALYPSLRRYLVRLVGESEAEDVIQDVFLKALRAAPGMREHGAVRPWLFRVATNAALDRLRSAHRTRVRASIDDGRLVESGSEPSRCPRPSVERETIRREMSSCVQAVVDRLPGSQRLALLLSEYEGLSDAEIAAAAGATLGSVKIRLHRARARLRKELDSACRIYGDERNELACEPIVPLAAVRKR